MRLIGRVLRRRAASPEVRATVVCYGCGGEGRSRERRSGARAPSVVVSAAGLRALNPASIERSRLSRDRVLEEGSRSDRAPVRTGARALREGILSQGRDRGGGIDFDAFSEAEICVLENHGYLLAEIAMRRHASHLVQGGWPPPQAPHPEWMDEDKARRALAESAKTKLFARYR